MSGGKLRTTLLGFGAAVLVFAVLVWLVGVDDLAARLEMADLRLVGVVLLAVLAWLAAWGGALRTVLGVLGVEVSVPTSFLTFAGAMFSNNVTPFGQAGGEPVTALLISRLTDTEYETGLAAIASVDTLNFLPSVSLALVGIGFYATEVALGDNRNVLIAVVAVSALAVLVPAFLYVLWDRRYGIEARVVTSLTPVVRWVARIVPPLSPPSPETIEERINGFFGAIERIGEDPRGLAVTLGFSTAGWLCQILGLWVAFHAIGTPIPFGVAMFAVPIGAIAGATPLPGGAGGIEVVLATLLAAVTGPAVGFATATAAVVIFRGLVYWTPTFIGGVFMTVAGVRSSSSA
jgi:hypothetical protein